MSTRGNYYDRPSPREWGPPPDWKPYDDYGMPPRQGPPPSHYDDYDLPSDNYFDRPPPPRYPDERPPPPRFYEEEPPFEEYNRTAPPHRPALHSKRGRPPVNQRGRGRGQNGGGRGQSYSRGRALGHSINSPKPPTIKDESGKPVWLSQPTTTTPAQTSSSDSSFSKPSWLSQSTASTASSGSSSKPPWLAESPDGTDSSDASSSKPSWMNQSVNKTTTMPNSNTSKPSWLTQSKASTDNAKSKPAWLSQHTQSTPKQATRFSPNPQAFTHANDSKDSLPPPPPPYPPPSNQPKIPPTTQQPFTVPPGQDSIMSKANKKVKSKLLKANVEVKVATPGENNFISFKNTLQEYCQKKGFPVPSYKSFKNSYGYSATVELSNGKNVKTSIIQKDKKDAEQFAAYEALKNLGIIAAGTPFSAPPKIGAKRPTPTPQAVAKKLKSETPPSSNNSPNYKCQLNQFCQMFHLPVPTYETAYDGGVFITTLVYNKKVHQSTAPQATKREAEQNVAQLVLSKVNQAPPPTEPQKGPIVYPNFVVGSTMRAEGTANDTAVEEEKPESNTTAVIPVTSVKDLTAKYVVPVVSYKNKLQEVCQKQKIDLPVYESSRDDKLYSCKVTIQSKVFSATGCKTKKGSEQSAARVALQALGLLTE